MAREGWRLMYSMSNGVVQHSSLSALRSFRFVVPVPVGRKGLYGQHNRQADEH